MKNERATKLQRLFDRVTAAPPASRRALINEAARSEPDLIPELEQLLAADASVGVLDQTPVELAGPPDMEGVPSQIGSYRVVRRIATGGFASVYEGVCAEPFPQRVAIKLLRSDLVGTLTAARFRLEQHALARLTHPHIARVLASGTTGEAQPFTVLEHIEGEPLDRFVLRTAPDLDARVAMIKTVAEAVDAMHRAGVIHRDLKPDNVLVSEVSGRPFPKVIDLGIAKLNDPDHPSLAMATEESTVLGTPRYMSPEQRAGDGSRIDRRTDVFALGLLLSDVLGGEPPHANPNARGQPARLPTRLRGRWRDAAAIVAKATATAPDDRYGSAGELALDLDRLRNGEPLIARRPSLWYIGSSLARRYKSVAAAALMALVSLIVFAVQQTRQAATERSLRTRTQDAEATLLARNAELDRQIRLVQAVNTFLTEDMLRSPDPSVSSKDVRVAEVLDRSAAAAPARFADFPDTQAAVLHTVGLSNYALGRAREATVALRDAERLMAASAGPADSAEARRALDQVRFDLAEALSFAGDTPASEAIWLACLSDRRRLYGQEHKETVRVVRRLTELWTATGRYAEAISISQEGLTAISRTYAPDSDEVVSTLNALAVAQMGAGRSLEAAASFRRLLDGLIRSRGADHPSTLVMMNNLARAAFDAADLDGSIQWQRELVERRTRVLGADHPNTRMAMINLGSALVLAGKTGEAACLIEDSVPSMERALGAGTWSVLSAYQGLAALRLAQSRPVDALAIIDQVIADGPRGWNNAPNQLAGARLLRARILRSLGLTALAQVDAQAALDLVLPLGEHQPRVQQIYAVLANIANDLGDAASVQAYRQRSGAWVELLRNTP